MHPLQSKNGAGGILYWVCPSVSECVSESVRPENLVNTIMSKTNEGNFTQFWSRVYLGS